MGIKRNWTDQQVKEYLQNQSQKIFQMVVNRVRLEGEAFRLNARRNGNYTDRTGNLRASIGYLIVWNGKIVDQNFTQSRKGTDRTTGTVQGFELAKSLVPKYSTGIALICVAGMDYAAKVESTGKDVITGSTQTLTNNLKQSLKALERKLNG